MFVDGIFCVDDGLNENQQHLELQIRRYSSPRFGCQSMLSKIQN